MKLMKQETWDTKRIDIQRPENLPTGSLRMTHVCLNQRITTTDKRQTTGVVFADE